MAKIYEDLTKLVGHTPLVELGHVEKAENLKARLVAKVEYFNPGGSVKDRTALSMIEDAEARGILSPSLVLRLSSLQAATLASDWHGWLR